MHFEDLEVNVRILASASDLTPVLDSHTVRTPIVVYRHTAWRNNGHATKEQSVRHKGNVRATSAMGTPQTNKCYGQAAKLQSPPGELVLFLRALTKQNDPHGSARGED